MAGGKLITFEGGEGSGKSTQARMLADHLIALGVEVVLTREPGGSPFAEQIRELILSERPVAPETEFLLFAAARAEHIAVTIAPAIQRGAWVICDRFIDSTRVYQGNLWGIEPDLIAAIETYTVHPYMPDLTVLLDVPTDVGMERARARGAMSRYDSAKAEQHEILRQGFLAIAFKEPARCLVIDGTGDPDDVSVAIRRAVGERLSTGAL